MSTATEPLTVGEEITLQHTIEDAIKTLRWREERDFHPRNFWAKRVEELRSAANKLNIRLNEAYICSTP